MVVILGDDAVDCKKLFEDGSKMIQMQSVGAVGLGVRRIVVDLEEDAIDSGGYCGAGQDGDELGLAA